MTKLVDEHTRTDDGKIVNHHLAGNLRTVADDAAAADEAVVPHVHPFHQQVVAPHDGAAFGSRAAVDGHIFADGIVVADFGRGLFTTKFQILRDGTNHSARKERVVVPHACAAQQRHRVHQMIVVANHHIGVDKTERADFAVVTNDGVGMNVGKRRNHKERMKG